MINKDVYIPPTVTVDGVVFEIVDGALSVLLIRRSAEPFKGEWALPGGFMDRTDASAAGAARCSS